VLKSQVERAAINSQAVRTDSVPKTAQPESDPQSDTLFITRPEPEDSTCVIMVNLLLIIIYIEIKIYLLYILNSINYI
jgi:hypothetical protein